MPESRSTVYRRRLRMVDNAILNAIADLYPYYCVVLQADPVLGAACEQAILDLEATRDTIHKVYLVAWQQDHQQFDTIGEAAVIIQEHRYENRLGGKECPDYSALWDRSLRRSSALLEKRAEALQRQSASSQDRRVTSNPLPSHVSLNK